MTEELSSIVEYAEDIKKQEAPEPLPTGNYTGVIRSVEKKESQRGTQYAAVSFHIGADQYPADFKDGNDDGTVIVHRRASLEDNPQARYGTKRFLEAIGAPMGKRLDISEWVGMEAELEVGHDEYEGVNRAVINRVNAA